MSSRIIAVDLGTTNCCVVVMENGEPLVLPNAEGSRTTPSIVAFTDGGERFVGQQAKRQAVINADRTIYGVKRLIGRKYRDPEVQSLIRTLPFLVTEHANGDAWVKIQDSAFSPQEISAAILQKMKATAEDYFGEEVTEAVITVPAYFDDAQRQATKDAGKIAGLEVRRILNEPTAAALAYGTAKRPEGYVAVFDLGGGTFDVSILRLRKGVFEVVATCGDNALGGDDFDRAVLIFLLDRFREETGIDLSGDRMALQRLKEASEAAKCELSTLSETNINLPFLAVNETGPKHLSCALTRSTLNDLCMHLVERLDAPCRIALADAKLTPDKLADVILVGGMTRMPLVQERVETLFQRRPNKGVNPDEVVAIGAAVQGGIIVGEVREVILLDVTPLSLGIRTRGDGMSVIIPKNSHVPTQFKKIFTTTEDNQDLVTITVCQGESERASENRQLGIFHLTEIPAQPAGGPRIEVTFDIDTDGIVHVSAEDLSTHRAQSIVIRDQVGMSGNEMDAAMERTTRHSPVERAGH